MNFINCFFRLFRKRDYMMYSKPCPRCGGRRVYFDIAWSLDTNERFCLICDDCGFKIEHYHSDALLNEWERIPRGKRRAE